MADKQETNTPYPGKTYHHTGIVSPNLTSGDNGARPYASNRKIKAMIDRAEQAMNNINFKG